MQTTDQLSQTQLGPYLLAEQIGRGGAASVYRAHQPSLGRDVAVKVLLRDADPQFAMRFEREARAIASLNHPNILPVYDYGAQGDIRYLVMRYVEAGRSLRDLLADGPVAPAPALRLAAHLLDGLAYAHARGIVHRDIKPGNVLLPSPDWPLLADFGIARVGADTQQLTGIGQVIGTPDYMSPEQGTGRPVDARSDLYSVGVVLYELLAGRVPFQADNPLAVVVQHVHDPPPDPQLLNPALPPLITPVLLRALEKDPGARYQSAAEMAAALREVADQIERGSLPAPTRAGQHARRPTLLAALGGLALLLGLAWYLYSAAAPTVPAAGQTVTRLDDERWQGGFRRTGGPSIYGGRTATWVYGTATPYSAMRVTFELRSAPSGTAQLTVEGMDSEGRGKTPISIQVNGVEIYRGPNPLPDDDLPLESGTWSAHTWSFDAALLHTGSNEIQISNLAEGAFSLPPFFMLDYADLLIPGE